MTTRRTSAGLAVFCATVLLITACDRNDTTSPFPLSASPTVTSVPTPTATIVGTLSGLVFEVTSAGRAPVEGVRVYCDACGAGHVDSYTDGNGMYRFADVLNAVYPLWVEKQGYDLANPTGPAASGWMGSVDVRVVNDTRFDIEIVRQ